MWNCSAIRRFLSNSSLCTLPSHVLGCPLRLKPAACWGLLCSVETIQFESALALGMTRAQLMRHVVLPQAVTLSIQSFVANIIFLLKETSVFSAISLMDLMFVAKDLIGLYYKTTECLVLLVIFYLIMILPVSILGTYIERRLRHGSFGPAGA